MLLASNWITLLVLRTLVALCLGGALTLAYSLGGMIVPVETRGAAFGWLALGVQIGTAASPLLALLVFGARDLLDRRERAET